MATYVLISGAGSDAWYWHRVVPLLRAEGHRVVVPELPVDDDAAGLMDGGHLPALSRPEELVRRLEAYRAGAGLR